MSHQLYTQYMLRYGTLDSILTRYEWYTQYTFGTRYHTKLIHELYSYYSVHVTIRDAILTRYEPHTPVRAILTRYKLYTEFMLRYRMLYRLSTYILSTRPFFSTLSGNFST